MALLTYFQRSASGDQFNAGIDIGVTGKTVVELRALSTALIHLTPTALPSTWLGRHGTVVRQCRRTKRHGSKDRPDDRAVFILALFLLAVSSPQSGVSKFDVDNISSGTHYVFILDASYSMGTTIKSGGLCI